MELTPLVKSISKILTPIPGPVIFWAFVLIILAVFAFIVKKMWDLKGE